MSSPHYYPTEINTIRATLSTDQQRVFDLFFIERENIFLSGPGGVGKSFVVTAICQACSMLGRNVLVSASTGIAAVNIGGRTLHNLLGLRLAEGPIEYLEAEAKKLKFKYDEWRKADVLIVDEISMVTPEFFQTVHHIVCQYRCGGNGGSDNGSGVKPFGGIQLLFVGDMFQLPPVQPEVHHESKFGDFLVPRDAQFVFELPLWRRINPTIIELTEPFRQKDDLPFFNALNRIRIGAPTLEDVALIETRINAIPTQPAKNDGGGSSGGAIRPTRIYTRNFNVQQENRREYMRLVDTDERQFAIHAESQMAAPFVRNRALIGVMKRTLENAITTMESGFTIARTLHLKRGTQVMMTANVDVKSGLVNGSRGIVRGFGTTDDGDYDGDDNKEIHDIAYPIVDFVTHKGVLCVPHCWRKDLSFGSYVISQIPLRYAWATTVHKSQGASLDCARIDLNGTFEAGQAYVALSRIRNLNGLSLMNFDATCIFANEKVKQFYANATPTTTPKRKVDSENEANNKKSKKQIIVDDEDDDDKDENEEK